MSKTLLILALLLSVVLIGCGSFTGAPDSEIEYRQFSNETSGGAAGAPGPAGAPVMKESISPQSQALGDDADIRRGAFGMEANPFAEGAPSASAAPVSGGGDSSLQLAQRQVISTASISIEVEEVQVASAAVRGIAESLGGFVEQLSSSGRDSSQQANITIRVPQDRFSTAVERLMGLGEVQNQNQGSEDVSERFIDLKARLKSAEREEQSLLSYTSSLPWFDSELACLDRYFRGESGALQRRTQVIQCLLGSFLEKIYDTVPRPPDNLPPAGVPGRFELCWAR